MKENKILYILYDEEVREIIISSYDKDKILIRAGQLCLTGDYTDELRVLELDLDEVE